jgi:hypothetical protein
VSWYVHLKVNSGTSTIGPFSEEAARETAKVMISVRRGQGYDMTAVSSVRWRSETHRMEIWIEEGK